MEALFSPEILAKGSYHITSRFGRYMLWLVFVFYQQQLSGYGIGSSSFSLYIVFLYVVIISLVYFVILNNVSIMLKHMINALRLVLL